MSGEGLDGIKATSLLTIIMFSGSEALPAARQTFLALYSEFSSFNLPHTSCTKPGKQRQEVLVYGR